MSLTFTELCHYYKTDRFVFDITSKISVEKAFDVIGRVDFVEDNVLVVFNNVK